MQLLFIYQHIRKYSFSVIISYMKLKRSFSSKEFYKAAITMKRRHSVAISLCILQYTDITSYKALSI